MLDAGAYNLLHLKEGRVYSFAPGVVPSLGADSARSLPSGGGHQPVTNRPLVLIRGVSERPFWLRSSAWGPLRPLLDIVRAHLLPLPNSASFSPCP